MSIDDEAKAIKELSESPKEKIIKGLYLRNRSKGMLDAIQEKVVSRKLLVFFTATGLLAWAGLDSDTWGMIAVVYIGGQSIIDAAKAWRHG
jgi:hypothetical protein